MAAGIEEHPGNEAGRVTLVTTLTSMIPTVFVCLMIVAAFLIEMISAEIAAATLLTALGLGSSISSTVFTTAKKTKTDRADVIWGSAPVTDVVTPTGPVVSGEVIANENQDDTPVPAGTHAASLADEVAQVRAGGAA